MRRGYAVCDSHQALHLQKLRFVGDATGAVGAAREAETKHGIGGRRKAETQKRIPEMVA